MGDTEGLAARLAELATDATRLRCQSAAPNGLLEATAALQDLAFGSAPADGPGNAAALLAALAALQAGLPATIQSATNGPYLATNVTHLVDWLSVPLRSLPQMALCHCGESKGKPWCDGSHAEISFMDRQSMSFAFDLWSYQDVVQHAQAILVRLQSGTMPCDGAWPKERVDLFVRWVTSGIPE